MNIVRLGFSLGILLLSGCSTGWYVANLQEDDIRISRELGGIGYGATSHGSEVIERGLEALEELVPLAEEEARRTPEPSIRYRTAVLAILFAEDMSPPGPQSASSSDTFLTPLDSRSLAVVDACLRSGVPNLQALALGSIARTGDARMFGMLVAALERELKAAPAAGESSPEPVQEVARALVDLGTVNGAALRTPGQSGLSEPWPSLSANLLQFRPWNPAGAQEICDQLTAWLAARAKDLPPQVLWPSR